MDKKELYYKMELWVDKSIPYLVILLLLMIIIDFGFHEEVEPYEIYILIFDYVVIAVFCIDLVFKYLRVRKIPEFLKKHWLDIIAIFPFFLLFRFFEWSYGLIKIPQLLLEPQTALHESILLEKEGLRLVKAAERTEKLSRTRLLFRFIRPIQRLPRLLKIIPYFERPTLEHHKTIEEISEEKLKSRKH